MRELVHELKSSRKALFENGIEEIWLPTRDAANYLGLSPNALRILVFRNKIKAYKMSNRLRFALSDLRLLLKLKEE